MIIPILVFSHIKYIAFALNYIFAKRSEASTWRLLSCQPSLVLVEIRIIIYASHDQAKGAMRNVVMKFYPCSSSEKRKELVLGYICTYDLKKFSLLYD